jgi:hypothetical protein
MLSLPKVWLKEGPMAGTCEKGNEALSSRKWKTAMRAISQEALSSMELLNDTSRKSLYIASGYAVAQAVSV